MSVVANGLVGFAAAVVSLSSMPVTAAERVSDAMASSAPPSTAESVDLDAAIDAFVGDEDGGAVVLVVRDGVTTAATAGVANSAGAAMASANAFRVGSLSKAIRCHDRAATRR
jgi:CubicO group peptidase (beta-lactamase class C family)